MVENIKFIEGRKKYRDSERILYVPVYTDTSLPCAINMLVHQHTKRTAFAHIHAFEKVLTFRTYPTARTAYNHPTNNY